MTNTDLVDSLQPAVRRVSEETPKAIAVLTWNAPFRWLRLGWRDIAEHPLTSLFYSSPFWFMALVLDAIFLFEAEYAMMAISICLLLGPFVAMGLYDTSLRREKGMVLDFLGSLTCWRKHPRSMGMLSRLSALVIAYGSIFLSGFARYAHFKKFGGRAVIVKYSSLDR